jgi:hypothetical protein
MAGNIKKIRDRQLAAPQLSETLQDLVINELKEKKHTATEGLLWLSRYVSLYSYLGPLFVSPISPSMPYSPFCSPFPQRRIAQKTNWDPTLQWPRLHRPSPPRQPLQPLRRAQRLVPWRLRQHTQAPPLLRRQAHIQRRHVRDTVQEGLLQEAG